MAGTGSTTDVLYFLQSFRKKSTIARSPARANGNPIVAMRPMAAIGRISPNASAMSCSSLFVEPPIRRI
jgi:hypothetical protein